MSYFPMMINLESRHVLVVGGKEEGSRKVEILHAFGAHITLIAPEADKGAIEMAYRYKDRKFEAADILEEEYAMVVAATNDNLLNETISSLAKSNHIPVNVVDNTELCTFIFPAVIKEGDVVCSVSSGGKSPYVAQYVKGLIRNVLPPEISEINNSMGEYRAWAKEKFDKAEERRAFLKSRLDELLKEYR